MGTYENQYRKPLGDLSTNSHEISAGATNSTSWRSWWYTNGLSFGWRRRKNGNATFQQYEQSNYECESSNGCTSSVSLPEPEFVVIFAPQNASISNIMSQIGGGPLRKVLCLQRQPFPLLYLEFIDEYHTQCFRDQVKSQKCLVNGMIVVLCSHSDLQNVLAADTKGAERFKKVLLQNSENLLQQRALRNEYIVTPNAVSFEQKAKRTLKLYLPVTARGSFMSLQVSPAHVYAIFIRLGSIIQVRPMFAKNEVAFSIEYASITSASMAMKIFRDEIQIDRNTRLERPEFNLFGGLHSWTLEFAEDPSERRFHF